VTSDTLPWTKKKTKLRGFGPRTNYADRVTAAYWRSSGSFCGQRVLRGQRNGFSRSLISTFLTVLFLQVAPQLFSRGWVDPVPDPLFLRKSGSPGNRTQDIWICSQKLWPLDHRGGPLPGTLIYITSSGLQKYYYSIFCFIEVGLCVKTCNNHLKTEFLLNNI
jgi:hypothetical protein